MRGAQAGASTAYGVFVYVLSMSMRNLSQLSLASINLYEKGLSQRLNTFFENGSTMVYFFSPSASISSISYLIYTTYNTNQ